MDFKLILLLLFSISIAQCFTIHPEELDAVNKEMFEAEWAEFKVKYGKNYTLQEDSKRKLAYAINKRFILEHNDRYDKGVVTYRLKMTETGDTFPEEWIATTTTTQKPNVTYEENTTPTNENRSTINSNSYHDYNILQALKGSTFVAPQGIKIPAAMDWRKFGAVTRVKHQGFTCGSCWAFSAVGALEGQLFRETGRLVELSVQNLVDCVKKNFFMIFKNKDGCQGGNPPIADVYVALNGGIDTEKSYPYTGKFGECRYRSKYSILSDNGFAWIPIGNEEMLQIALATVGPISVLIDASGLGMRFYDSGVYFNPDCSETKLNHAVLLVGYGKDAETGVDYWLIKNSWGTDWGENGYMRVARNRRNHCGIASIATYPLLSGNYAFNSYGF